MSGLARPTVDALRAKILHHLEYTLAKDAGHSSRYDWRMATSFAIRDEMLKPWFAATRQTYDTGAKRVYYLSMEFLIGRLLEDAMINLGLHETIAAALAAEGQTLSDIIEDEPDAALGNGGLGRLAACFLESMATVGVPAHGYGIRYEHGLFRQRFEGGQQVETPEDWLSQPHPWEFARPEAAYIVGFKGHSELRRGKSVWVPGETVKASAYDTPVVGWQGKWASTLRLWAGLPTTQFDLERFNNGDYTAAAAPEALARTLSRVLYPDDTTPAGKELRLKQEYFMTSAALQDILRRYQSQFSTLADLPKHVAIQLNDTHPAIAGPELMRLLMDQHDMGWDEAQTVARATLGYTNHTLLPEALERWSTYLMGSVLPRHMEIIQRIDEDHAKAHKRPPSVGIVQHNEVKMGDLAFIMSHKVNGVSALHSELVKETVFHDLHKLHPDRITNETNGVTPRRWMRLSNPALSTLLDETIGEGWTRDLDHLKTLEPFAQDAAFREKFAAAKRANKVALAGWVQDTMGIDINPDAMFDIQIKRLHEYKRQLLNCFETIALWHNMRQTPDAGWTPRVKFFGGKSAPGYFVAKEIIHLINDVARTINADPVTGHLLKVVYPPNYNVSMAQRLIPAADLSEQISTAGKEASGTGNMKLTLNGALTIGTLDGANVEIRDLVGADNFFLFGLTADGVEKRRKNINHAREAIEDSQNLRDVLQMIVEGRFSPEEPDRYHGLVDRAWHHDHYLVAADFDSYWEAQRAADALYRTPQDWNRKAILNVARSGFFSSDRTIRGYMADIWDVPSALKD
ncbi:glycogen/starch/alpha-glucan phosphorylase [Aquimixticola soesokkakensis]|uniref:glycogen/starch/alpha-glucan phosphorylase n=1 Tax=Aquimixticola soesokkakensis TaxID=1519096 RepID=UPI000A26FD80|nr:glycogen/starch/alpha-glucan phosphorylase [Aquimixticola soesokkakensis]